TDGTWAFGLHATGGGDIAMTGGSIQTNNAKGKNTRDGDGSRAYAIYATDADSSIETMDTIIVTQGQRAYGAYATNSGNVQLTGGSITTHGFMAYGAYASGTDSTVTTNNVDITTSGQVGDAIWAYNSGVVTINGGNILVQGGSNPAAPYESSYGARALGGPEGDGIVNINNASIVTLSPDSYGVLAGGSIGTVAASGIVNLNAAHVEVRGAGTNAAGTVSGGTLKASNG